MVELTPFSTKVVMCPLFSPSLHPLIISRRWSWHQKYPPDLPRPLNGMEGFSLLSRMTLAFRLISPTPSPRSVTYIPGVFSIQHPLMCPHVFYSKEWRLIQNPSRTAYDQIWTTESHCHFQRCPTASLLSSLGSLSSCFFSGHPSSPWPLPISQTL